MLPRNSGVRSRVGSARPALDLRKIILVMLALVLVAYFAVMSSFFSLSQQQASVITNGGGALTGNANAEPSAQEKKALADALAAEKAQEEREAAAAAAAAAPTRTRTRIAAMTQPPPHKPEHKWVRNPERRYVWLDVAIDDVYIGRITVELYADMVPKTAENFRVLTTGEKGPEYSFKNSVCHRILKGFIVQCGDFTTGKGYGGRSIYGNKFDDEPNGLRLTHSKRYILQMANSGPNTNGSQFCFMLGPAPHLNGHHVVFGEVVDGFDVVDKMENAGVQADGIALEHKVQFLDGDEYL